MADLAPIAVFTYKRPEHTARLLRSLAANPETSSSPVYVFCDGARSTSDSADVSATRRIVRELSPRHAVTVERDTNMGLAASIIAGVSKLTSEFSRVIVLEDDLVLSPVALRYFNEALVRYRDVDRVMHIAGYMFPVNAKLPETFFYREASCWGWATWERAWRQFEPDGLKIRDLILAKHMRYEFDVRNSMGFFHMLEQQISGKNNSWAIRWYGSMRLAGGLALHPGISLVENLGFDGTGEHCSPTSEFNVKVADRPVTQFTDHVEESEAAIKAMIAYRQKIWGEPRSLAARGRTYLRRLVQRAWNAVS